MDENARLFCSFSVFHRERPTINRETFSCEASDLCVSLGSLDYVQPNNNIE